MYDFPFYVDVCFRIINLVVLILLLRYLFVNYLLESIKKKIEERRQQIRSLQEHLIAVQHQRDILAAIIDQESGLSLQVQKKIARWAEAVAVEAKMRSSQKEHIMRKIQGYVLQKQETLMHKEAQLQVAPRALEIAEAALKQEFADPKLGALVIRHIMADLRVKQ